MARWARRLGAAAGGVAALVAGAIAVARWSSPDRLPLPPALDGERRTTAGRAGLLSYYVAGSGAPVLLVHSVNAAGSAYEVKPLFDALRGERRVFAFDLPGFGFSDRSERTYDIALYADAVRDMLDVVAREAGPGPVDAVALSLGAEFVARAAAERPDAFRTLAFVSPTGLDRRSAELRGPPGASRENRPLAAFLGFPPWSQALFDALSSRASIRFFLEKTWGSENVDEGAAEYAYLTTHQPGARRAPFAFVSGRLFAADARAVYERLAPPVLVLHGTRGGFTNISGLGDLRGRPTWRVVAFDAGALPHFERPEAALAAYRAFRDAPPR